MGNMKLQSEPINFKLKGVDGKYHTLDEFKDKDYLAIIFSCNHCPYVVASEREFVEIQKEYGSKGVQLIAINPNAANSDYPADSYENMIKRAEEKDFNFPYLVDETQEVAKKYNAGRTPEIFLFDKSRELVYHGRINDNPKNHNQITRHDFQEALDELLSGEEISVPKTKPIGCSIKYTDY